MTDPTSPQSLTIAPKRSQWYATAMAHLIGIVQDLSQARDIRTIARIVAGAANATIGADGATFILREGDEGHCVEQTGEDTRWRGRRFPLAGSITGGVILSRTPLIIPDLAGYPGVPPGAHNPDVSRGLAVIPIRRSDPVGAVCVFWREVHAASDEEVAVLQALADITSVAWENVALFENLQETIKRLEVQQARIQAQHESLDVFARALAHDLKEPVRTVRAFSDLIVNYDDPPEVKQGYLELIRKASDRMAMLVDTVFEYTQLDDPSRLTTKTMRLQNALQGARENLAQLINERKATITTDPLPEVDANPTLIMQVMQNLIANALRHGPEGVSVHVTAHDDGAKWHICVTDTGPGVAESDQERIFKPFKRLNLNEEGAGLGLATCRKILALHGGAIWCTSSPGAGATFHFTLPKSPRAAAKLPLANHRVRGRRLANVLLVDDREADVELTRVLLQVRDRMEFNLTVAHDGRQALDVLRDARKRGVEVDLVLLDINMPGMDGFEMLEAMQKDPALGHTPVVMCSGSTHSGDLNRARAMGVAGYMVKPPSLEQLLPLLEGIPQLTLDQAGEAKRLLRAA